MNAISKIAHSSVVKLCKIGSDTDLLKFARKPVFKVSDQAQNKSAHTSTS